MKQLYTRWGRDLDPQNVLQEYPRPLLKRGSYINLNGYWDYTFTKYLKNRNSMTGRSLFRFHRRLCSPVYPGSCSRTNISGTGAHLRLKNGLTKKQEGV